MKPATAIALLDRQIAKHGQPVKLRRAGSAPVETALSAFVREYRADELVGAIQQGDTLITISPTALAGSPFAAEAPRKSDRLFFDGRLLSIQTAEPVRIAGQIVRFNLQARG